MRRKDREVTDLSEIIEIMKNCDVCRLALNDDGFPYILPLNFGMAVNGNGAILISKAYLEGGASFQDETAPIRGNVRFGENTCRNLVTGKGNTTDKSEFYWFGTGDANGIIPQIDKTLAQIPQNTFAAPKITYKNGKGFVNLTWTEIDNAEKVRCVRIRRWKMENTRRRLRHFFHA